MRRPSIGRSAKPKSTLGPTLAAVPFEGAFQSRRTTDAPAKFSGRSVRPLETANKLRVAEALEFDHARVVPNAAQSFNLTAFPQRTQS